MYINYKIECNNGKYLCVCIHKTTWKQRLAENEFVVNIENKGYTKRETLMEPKKNDKTQNIKNSKWGKYKNSQTYKQSQTINTEVYNARR